MQFFKRLNATHSSRHKPFLLSLCFIVKIYQLQRWFMSDKKIKFNTIKQNTIFSQYSLPKRLVRDWAKWNTCLRHSPNHRREDSVQELATWRVRHGNFLLCSCWPAILFFSRLIYFNVYCVCMYALMYMYGRHKDQNRVLNPLKVQLCWCWKPHLGP